MQTEQMPQVDMPTPQPNPQMPQSPAPHKNPKSKKVWLWSVIAVIVLLVLGASVYLNQGTLFKGELGEQLTVVQQMRPVITTYSRTASYNTKAVDYFKKQFIKDLKSNAISSTVITTKNSVYTLKAPSGQGITFSKDGTVNINTNKTSNSNFTFLEATPTYPPQSKPAQQPNVKLPLKEITSSSLTQNLMKHKGLTTLSVGSIQIKKGLNTTVSGSVLNTSESNLINTRTLNGGATQFKTSNLQSFIPYAHASTSIIGNIETYTLNKQLNRFTPKAQYDNNNQIITLNLAFVNNGTYQVPVIDPVIDSSNKTLFTLTITVTGKNTTTLSQSAQSNSSGNIQNSPTCISVDSLNITPETQTYTIGSKNNKLTYYTNLQSSTHLLTSNEKPCIKSFVALMGDSTKSNGKFVFRLIGPNPRDSITQFVGTEVAPTIFHNFVKVTIMPNHNKTSIILDPTQKPDGEKLLVAGTYTLKLGQITFNNKFNQIKGGTLTLIIKNKKTTPPAVAPAYTCIINGTPHPEVASQSTCYELRARATKTTTTTTPPAGTIAPAYTCIINGTPHPEVASQPTCYALKARLATKTTTTTYTCTTDNGVYQVKDQSTCDELKARATKTTTTTTPPAGTIAPAYTCIINGTTHSEATSQSNCDELRAQLATKTTTTTTPPAVAPAYPCTIGGVSYKVASQSTCNKLNTIFKSNLSAKTPQNRVDTALAILRILGNNFRLRANLGSNWYNRFIDANNIASATPQEIIDARSAYSADVLRGRINPKNQNQITLAPFSKISKIELFTMFEQAYASVNGAQTIKLNNLPTWLLQAYQNNPQLKWMIRGYSFAVSRGIITKNTFTNMSQLLQITLRGDMIHYVDNFAASIGSNVTLGK